jgi:hypothetical protein
MTGQWNNECKTAGRAIILKNTHSRIYGLWQTPVGNDVYWMVTPQKSFLPATAQVLDCKPSAWADTPQNENQRHAMIKGVVCPDKKGRIYENLIKKILAFMHGDYSSGGSKFCSRNF